MILLILVATIPTGLIGVVLESIIKDGFSSLPWCRCLLITNIMLYLAETFGASSGKSAISYTDALLIGTVQGIAARSSQKFRVRIQQFQPVSCLALNDPSQLDFRFFFQFLPFSALSCSKERISCRLPRLRILRYLLGTVIAFLSYAAITTLIRLLMKRKLIWFGLLLDSWRGHTSLLFPEVTPRSIAEHICKKPSF